MGIGLSGMVSGLDTDAIVQAMVSAQRTKSTKIENKITLNKWTTEAWSGLNTKIYSFYTKYASKLRLQSSFMTRTAKSSNEDVVTAKAESTAAVGTHKLKIMNLASSQYVTGGQLMDKNDSTKKANYAKNTKLTDMKVAEGTVITITGKAGSKDEIIKKLEVTDSTTVNDFLEACKEAGLTANFDTKQQRFFISSAESGTDEKFTITSTGSNSTVANALDNVTSLIDTNRLSSDEKSSYDEAMTTIRQNLDVVGTVLNSYNEDTATQTEKSVKAAIDKVKELAADNQAEIAAKNNVNTDIKTALTSALTALANGTVQNTAAEAVTISDTSGTNKKTYTYAEVESLHTTAKTALEEKAKAKAAEEADKALEEVKDKYGDNYVTKAEVDAAQTTLDEYDTKYAAATTQEEKDALDAEKTAATEVINKWENTSLVDSENNPLVSLKEVYETEETEAYVAPTDAEIIAEIQNTMIADNQVVYDAVVAEEKATILTDAKLDTPTIGAYVANKIASIDASLQNAANEVNSLDGGLSEMGLGDVTYKADGKIETTNPKMAAVAAADAEFELDGAKMTETSNNFTVNGITLNLSATTESKDNPGTYESVQITVGKDGDATYDLIKEALTEYNKLIEEMNKLYNADSARGYDPLTDEQKEAMTEDDIKNWEDKIKGSLLRRDDSLGSLLNSMRSALSSTYTDEDDGKTYSLSTFGIVTGNYTEKGKLHIYGDEDDPTYATYNDRLKKALEDDPDQVMEVLTNVFGKLYDTMTEKCAKTEISSALTFYNDKQYKNLLDDYEDDLDIMEDRIKELEDRYYKQFTAMETALSKLQSQTNSLASLLGTGTQ